MTELEKKILVDALKELCEVALPALIDAEISKVPAQYQAIASGLWAAAKPQFIKLIDDQIAKL